MILQFDFSADQLQKCLSQFVSLVGPDRWRRRLDDLLQETMRFPALARNTLQYHWLEFTIEWHLFNQRENPPLSTGPSVSERLSALYFAQTVVEIHSRMTQRGQAALRGRLRHSLKAETGFASLYLEIDLARRLFNGGFAVEFPDFEDSAKYDLLFSKNEIAGEVECKSISADAGRQIHRKDFYRFIDAVAPQLIDRAKSGNEILLITLQGRLPSDVPNQKLIRDATKHILMTPSMPRIEDAFFVIERRSFDREIGATPLNDADELYDRCRKVFGQYCHVSGMTAPEHNCLIAMRSTNEDDHSRPIHDALKEADRQFSSNRPSFIFMQFNDIDSQDLLSVSLRRRMGILSYAFFFKRQPSHVASICYCAYNGLTISNNGVGVPAVTTPNPKPKFPIIASNYPLFLGHIPDAEFAAILGSPPPTENLSYIKFE